MLDREKEILELISFNPNILISEISEKLSISMATTNGVMRTLKQKGYIKRANLDEENKWIVLRIL